LDSKCNESKLHLEGARIISWPWFGYRYSDCLFLPRVPASELRDAFYDTGYLSIFDVTYYVIVTGA